MIAISDECQVCIEARIVEHQHSVAETVFAVGRRDGLLIGNRRAGIMDADQVGVVIVNNRRLSLAHAVAEEQKIDLLGLQPVFHPYVCGRIRQKLHDERPVKFRYHFDSPMG